MDLSNNEHKFYTDMKYQRKRLQKEKNEEYIGEREREKELNTESKKEKRKKDKKQLDSKKDKKVSKKKKLLGTSLIA